MKEISHDDRRVSWRDHPADVVALLVLIDIDVVCVGAVAEVVLLVRDVVPMVVDAVAVLLIVVTGSDWVGTQP